MKKFVCVLLALLSCTMLFGCAADGKADVSNRDEAVISINGKNFTKGNFYDGMIANNADQIIIDKLVDMIYKKEISSDLTDIEKKAQEYVDEFKETAGDSLAFYLYIYGLTSLDDYYEEAMYSLKVEAIAEKYIKGKEEELINEQKPVKALVIECADAEKAAAALTALNNGMDLDQLVAQYATSTSTSEVVIIKDTNALDEAVINTILSSTAAGILPDVLKNSDSTKFYVVKITDTNVQNYYDEFVSVLLDNSVVTSDEVMGYYAKAGGFAIYDEEIFNNFKTNHKTYIND